MLDNELGEARERYQALIVKPDDIEDILLAGAAQGAPHHHPIHRRVARGSRPDAPARAAESAERQKKAAKAARLVSFRDDDGSFRFRLLDAAGEQLLLSRAPSPMAGPAGAVSKRLLAGETADLRAEGNAFGLWLDGEAVAQSPAFADAAARDAAIERTREALAPRSRQPRYILDGWPIARDGVVARSDGPVFVAHCYRS